MRLDSPRAERLARLILPSLAREYPFQLVHLVRGSRDIKPPRELTPMFYGCFDWHSAVHSHWALARLVRLFPGEAWTKDARAALRESFTEERVAGELAYLADRPGFEMPYGNAWLLQLAAELLAATVDERDPDPDLTDWNGIVEPLGAAAGRRMLHWLQRLGHPIRTGEHSQTAFAMSLAFDWSLLVGDNELADVITEKTKRFYGDDKDAPLAYEPSAFDFFSPALAEADLMRRLLRQPKLAAWLKRFLPDGVTSFTPVLPVDRSDGKLAHFDGLNLSRAWMMLGIASELPRGHELRDELLSAAAHHERVGMSAIEAEGELPYAGAHWLGSFAVYLLSDAGA